MEMDLKTYLPLFIATLVGFLIGIEREKAHPSRMQIKMGVRSFVLIAFLGALAGWIEQRWVGVVASVFPLVLILVARFRPAHRKTESGSSSVITEVTAAIVFCLGYAANQDPIGVAFLGPLVALILVMKERLHRLTGQIRLKELEAAIILLLLGAGVIGLVADRAIDQWGLFNPRKFGILVLILAALEFTSYLTMKFFPERQSALLTGILGGLVSSTAVLLATARESQHQPKAWRRHVTTSVAATVASFGEVIFIVMVVSISLTLPIILSVGAACVFGVAATWVRLFKVEKLREAKQPVVTLRSPLNLRGVLRLAVLLAAILMIVGLAQRTIGDRATEVLAFLTGLFELHGFSLATATLYTQGQLTRELAIRGLGIGAIGGLCSKLAIVLSLGRGAYARNMFWILSLMLIVLLVALFSEHVFW